MSRPCKVLYYQNYWDLYKEDCDRELNAKTKKIEELDIEVKKQITHYVEIYNKNYCLKKKIENSKLKENEELEKKLSPWHEKSQQTRTRFENSNG